MEGFHTSNTDKEPTGESVNVLDNLDYDAARAMLENTSLREVFLDIGKDATVVLASIPEAMPDQVSPRTFDEMLDASTGTVWQRLSKFFLKTGDPEKAQIFLRALGAGQYRKLTLQTIGRLRKAIDKEEIEKQRNTNYFLGGRSDAHLLDFALRQCTKNEFIHIVGALVCLGFAATDSSWEDLAGSSAFFLANVYCVLTQRLTRAEIAEVLEKRLAKGKLNLDTYIDTLNLRMPTPRRT